MFGTLLSTGAALLHLYVFWRAGTVPAVTRLIPRGLVRGGGALLFGFYLLARFVGHGAEGLLGRWLELLGMDWLAILFLTATCFLAVDLATGFGFLFRRAAPILRGGALAAGLALSMLAVVQGLRPPAVTEWEVRLDGLPGAFDGTVLVALSDLHLGSLLGADWLAGRVEQVAAERPDLVLFLGDLGEGHGRPDGEVLPVLRRIEAPLGVWAVNGNHESHGRDGAGERLLEEAGFRVLRDGWSEAAPGLVLAGVDYAGRSRSPDESGRSVGRAVAGRPPGAAVLLSHAPVGVERAAAAGVGLMLSGHTHGGQVWPFGWLVRLTTPYVAGRYEVGGMTLLVGRGTGTWGPRMRLWRRGEILRVVLRSGEAP